MGGSDKVLISYETLFELLRREKNREDLQSLPKGFAEEVQRFLQEKRDRLDPEQLTSYEVWEKMQLEVQNLLRILRELYDRREKKILQLSMIRSRTTASIVDMNVFLPHELAIFEDIAATLERHRQESYAALPQRPAGWSSRREALSPISILSPNTFREAESINAKLNKEAAAAQRHIRLRLQVALPKFVGPNLDVYGPYAKNAMVELPETIALVLLEKKHAALAEEEKPITEKPITTEIPISHETSQDDQAPVPVLPEAHGT